MLDRHLEKSPLRHLRDLREYLDALRGEDELLDITAAVDLDLEIGAIARRCYETGAPAALFHNIRNVENGFRVLAAPAGISNQPEKWLARVALSCGLPAKATGQQIVASLVDARNRPAIPPRVVPVGPCQERVLTGNAIDLTLRPAPLLHQGDGGRFLNTFGIIVAQTQIGYGPTGLSPAS